MSDRPLSQALEGVRSIVVVKPSSLGDVVHTLPAVHLLRAARPDLSIRWVVNSEWRPLLEGNPDVDATIEFPRRDLRGLSVLWKAWGFRRTLRAQFGRDCHPDLAIDFQGLLRSALIARATAARRIIGLSDAREGAARLCTDIVSVDPSAHAVDRYLAVPRALGIPVDCGSLHFPLPAGRLPDAVELPPRFVALHPYARGVGKALTSTQIEAFCRALAPHPIVIVGVSGAVHRRYPPDRASGAGGVVDLTNRTSIPDLIAILRAAAFVVSVDSGPMHIAAALNPNVLGIHTRTDPRRVGPYPLGAVVWKAGIIGERHALTDAEAVVTRGVGAEDVQRIAAFVRGRIGPTAD